MDKYEVAVMAEDYQQKRLRFEHLRMCNTVGLTAEEATQLSVDYHVAEAEMLDAYRVLERAKFK